MKRGVLLLALGAAVASAAAAAALVGSIGPSSATASSHREAPLIADDPAADNTDVYAFVSPDKPNTVTIIANYIPFEDPAGGPNYYKFDPTVLYSLNIDNDGDAREDVAYQFRFKTTVEEPEHVPLQHGPDRHAGEPGGEPQREADVLGHACDALGEHRAGLEPGRAAGEHRASLEPDLRRVPGRRRPRRRPQGLRRAARRSVLRRPRVDLRSGRPAAVQLAPRHPARRRGRTRTGC